jgi:threonine aldolase
MGRLSARNKGAVTRVTDMDFASDNTAGAAPEVWAALAGANGGNAASYGADAWTARVTKAFSRLFERDVAVFPVVSGIAANCLALSVLTPRYGTIYAHREAHVNAHESTAPEFYTGARLVPLPGAMAKIDPAQFEAALTSYPRGDVHVPQPGALSLTQATEVGTTYSVSEIAGLSAIAHRNGLGVHIDGARFANAIASLGVTPAEATWKAGADALSFGFTKNGAIAAEAVVFFDPERARDFIYQRKRAGHLLSKMRFVSAQIEAMLQDDLWLELARRANAMARKLADGLAEVPAVKVDIPAQTNAVFPLLTSPMIAHLDREGVKFYPWGPPENDGMQRARFVCSFATTEQDIQRLLSAVRRLA